MKFCRLLGYDLRQGLSAKKYLIAVLIFAIRLYSLYPSARLFCGQDGTPHYASAGDCLLGMFRGMAIMRNVSIEERVFIPVGWLAVCAFCLYITAAYPAQGISVQGQQIFLRTSRGSWWLSKCIWCLAGCLAYFVCEIAVIAGAALLLPVRMTWSNTPEVTASLFSEVLWDDSVSLAPSEVFLYAVLLPFVTLLALCMLQTCLNLVLRPAVSFLVTFIALVVSAYFPGEYLVGNGAMVIRSRIFDAAGLDIYKELAAALLLMLLSVIGGWVIIRKKDLISLER